MFYELTEAFRIAFQVIRAHKMRSLLTALGVIIGIIAVTLMGSAISGIQVGFERSLAVIGVWSKMGTFLGLFSFDTYACIPLNAFTKTFSSRLDTSIRVKVKDKNRMEQAKGELIGDMRRVRGLRPEMPNDFEINEQQALRSTLDPIKGGIAIAGLFVTGLALFVGAIGIMNITYVSVKERTREIGTRKAIGAKRRSILLQFLVEAVAICLVGGVCGLTISWALSAAVAAAFPSFPMQFSVGLVFTGLIVSTLTGIFSGFAPALSASRLDPIEALRYE